MENKNFKKFLKTLENEDKDAALLFILSMLCKICQLFIVFGLIA